MQETFERGSPQGMALCLAPWVLWALFRLWQRPGGLRLALAAVAWAGVILIHNLTALLLLPVIALFFVYMGSQARPRRLIAPTLALLGGTMLAAFHVLPFVMERRYVQLAYINKLAFALPARNPLQLSDLLASPRLFDILRVNNHLGQYIGPLQAAILLLGLPLAFIVWRRGRRAVALLLAGLDALALMVVWMQLAGATPVWDALPALDVLQFRWRLLSLLAFATFAVAAALVAESSARTRPYVALALTVVLVGVQLPFLYPQLARPYLDFPQPLKLDDIRRMAPAANLPGLASFDEFLPVWRSTPLTADERAGAGRSLVTNLPAGAQSMAEMQHASGATFTLGYAGGLHGNRALTLLSRLARLCGFRAPGRVARSDSAYLSLAVPAGKHTVVLRYEGTPIQHVGEGLSLIAAVILVAGALLWRKKQGVAAVEQPDYLRSRDGGRRY